MFVLCSIQISICHVICIHCIPCHATRQAQRKASLITRTCGRSESENVVRSSLLSTKLSSGVFAQARKIITRDWITHHNKKFVRSHVPNGSEDASNVFTFMNIMVIIPYILYTLLIRFSMWCISFINVTSHAENVQDPTGGEFQNHDNTVRYFQQLRAKMSTQLENLIHCFRSQTKSNSTQL